MEDKKQDQVEKKPFYKKWWFWLIIGIVIVGIIGSIVGGPAGSSSNSGTNSGGNSSQTSTTHGMNETVTVGDLEYKVTAAYDTVKIGSSGDVTSYNYVVITLVVKNNSSSEKTLYSSFFSYYRGNNKYEPSTQALHLNSSNPFLGFEKVGADLSKTITIVYEIPSAHVATDYLQVQDSFRTEKIYMK